MSSRLLHFEKIVTLWIFYYNNNVIPLTLCAVITLSETPIALIPSPVKFHRATVKVEFKSVVWYTQHRSLVQMCKCLIGIIMKYNGMTNDRGRKQNERMRGKEAGTYQVVSSMPGEEWRIH